MSVRTATVADVDVCERLLAAFFEESGFSREASYDPITMRTTLENLITNDDGALFVAEFAGEIVGVVGGLAYSHYFNANERAAQELFWYLRPSRRGGILGIRMLQALEAWAKSRGCATLTMICLTIDSPAESVYLRTGYRATERSFMKRV